MLVVDDEAAIRNVIEDVLGHEGYEVLTAGDGRQAFAVLHAGPADVILLDLSMPVMDGFAFRRQQLLEPLLAEIPVIVISADYNLDKHLPALHPRAWLDKPFDLTDLLRTVAAVCVPAA